MPIQPMQLSEMAVQQVEGFTRGQMYEITRLANESLEKHIDRPQVVMTLTDSRMGLAPVPAIPLVWSIADRQWIAPDRDLAEQVMVYPAMDNGLNYVKRGALMVVRRASDSNYWIPVRSQVLAAAFQYANTPLTVSALGFARGYRNWYRRTRVEESSLLFAGMGARDADYKSNGSSLRTDIGYGPDHGTLYVHGTPAYAFYGFWGATSGVLSLGEPVATTAVRYDDATNVEGVFPDLLDEPDEGGVYYYEDVDPNVGFQGLYVASFSDYQWVRYTVAEGSPEPEVGAIWGPSVVYRDRATGKIWRPSRDFYDFVNETYGLNVLEISGDAEEYFKLGSTVVHEPQSLIYNTGLAAGAYWIYQGGAYASTLFRYANNIVNHHAFSLEASLDCGSCEVSPAWPGNEEDSKSNFYSLPISERYNVGSIVYAVDEDNELILLGPSNSDMRQCVVGRSGAAESLRVDNPDYDGSTLDYNFGPVEVTYPETPSEDPAQKGWLELHG